MRAASKRKRTTAAANAKKQWRQSVKTSLKHSFVARVSQSTRRQARGQSLLEFIRPREKDAPIGCWPSCRRPHLAVP